MEERAGQISRAVCRLERHVTTVAEAGVVAITKPVAKASAEPFIPVLRIASHGLIMTLPKGWVAQRYVAEGLWRSNCPILLPISAGAQSELL